MSGVLLSSNGKMTRAELRQIPAPEATPTHQPLAHYRIVEALLETFGFRHIQVTREEYAVSPDGMKMFGVLDLEQGVTDVSFSIGGPERKRQEYAPRHDRGLSSFGLRQHGVCRRLHARPPQALQAP